MNITKNIKELRTQRNITVEDMCKHIANISYEACIVSPEAWTAYEAGGLLPPLDLVYWFARYLGVSVDYILGIDEDLPPIKAPVKSPTPLRMGTLINKDDYALYDGQPVYVTGMPSEHEDAWGLLCWDKRYIVFSRFMHPIYDSLKLYTVE